jgi:hypothetical protein
MDNWQGFEERLRAIQEVGNYSGEQIQHIREDILTQASDPGKACHLALQILNDLLDKKK